MGETGTNMGPTCWNSETSVSLSETIEQLVTYTLVIVTCRQKTG